MIQTWRLHQKYLSEYLYDVNCLISLLFMLPWSISMWWVCVFKPINWVTNQNDNIVLPLPTVYFKNRYHVSWWQHHNRWPIDFEASPDKQRMTARQWRGKASEEKVKEINEPQWGHSEGDKVRAGLKRTREIQWHFLKARGIRRAGQYLENWYTRIITVYILKEMKVDVQNERERETASNPQDTHTKILWLLC